jgi:iron complex transport system permease protein
VRTNDGADLPVQERARVLAVSLVLLLLLCVFAGAGLTIGYVGVPFGEVLASLFAPADSPVALIVREIRLPRVLLALAVGASLGLAGAVLQGFLRNPLAEPGVIGVSASGGLGAVVALYFGFAAVSPLALPGAAMVGALASTIVIYLVAARDASTVTLILVGVAISSFSVALTSLALNMAPNPFATSEIVIWLLGSVRDRSFTDVNFAAPFMVVGWLLLLSVSRALDALTLGEDTARSLGVGMLSLRVRVIAGVSLAVGAAVAVSGTIGFVGLVVPHLLRPFLGHQPGILLVPSALGGAVLLAGADLVVRVVPTDSELMLGVVTSLLGAPFFLYLVVKTRRSLT